MPINYSKVSKLRNLIIEESKRNLPKMDMFQLYILAEMRFQTALIAHFGRDKKSVQVKDEEIDDLIMQVDESIKEENAQEA